MTHSEHDYEQAALWLEGRKIELTSRQQELADEIAALSAELGRVLDVPSPPGLLHRVRARMQQQRPRAAARLVRRRRWLAAPAAAVAAAILLASLLLPWPPTKFNATWDLSPAEILNAYLQGPEGNLSEQAEQLGLEIMNCRLDITSEGDNVELMLAGVQDDLDELMLDQNGVIAEEPELLLE